MLDNDFIKSAAKILFSNLFCSAVHHQNALIPVEIFYY